MNYIFTGYNSTLLPAFPARAVARLPASGATVLFNSTLIEKPKPPRTPSPFVASLLQFIGILRVKYIPYSNAPEVNPWAPPRNLSVSSLPHPEFYSHRPAKTFYPQISDPDAFEPFPLIPDMKEDDPEHLENGRAITAYAMAALPLKGILEQDETGLIYLNVPANFSEMLLPLIHEKGVEQTPIFIPVILAHEAKEKAGWGPIRELGEEFSFKLVGLYSLKPLFWPEVESVFFFDVLAPELDALREKYRIPGKQPLHMTLGIKKKAQNAPKQPELFRLNVSCNAA
jgi:hypothetical protein